MIDQKAVHRFETNLCTAQTANPKAVTQPQRHNYHAICINVVISLFGPELTPNYYIINFAPPLKKNLYKPF